MSCLRPLYRETRRCSEERGIASAALPLSMPTIWVEDPETGERFPLISQRRGSRVYLRRLSRSAFDVDRASARQLENWAQFSEVASSAFGAKSEGRLPSAAEAVRRARRPTSEPAPTPREERSRLRQAYYSSLPFVNGTSVGDEPEARDLDEPRIVGTSDGGLRAIRRQPLSDSNAAESASRAR